MEGAGGGGGERGGGQVTCKHGACLLGFTKETAVAYQGDRVELQWLVCDCVHYEGHGCRGDGCGIRRVIGYALHQAVAAALCPGSWFTTAGNGCRHTDTRCLLLRSMAMAMATCLQHAPFQLRAGERRPEVWASGEVAATAATGHAQPVLACGTSDKPQAQNVLKESCFSFLFNRREGRSLFCPLSPSLFPPQSHQQLQWRQQHTAWCTGLGTEQWPRECHGGGCAPPLRRLQSCQSQPAIGQTQHTDACFAQR